MALDPKFRTVGSFEAESPLDRQLDQLETNASAAFRALASQAWAKLTPTNEKTSDYPAKLGELVMTDGDIRVMLPVSSPQNAGEAVGVIVALEHVVTTFSAQSDVQGGDEDQIPEGMWLYISTGAGWWRGGGVTTITVGPGLTGGGTGDVEIGVDGDYLVTSSALNAAVQSTRLEVEKLRVLVMQLVKVEMGDALDRGWEAAGA